MNPVQTLVLMGPSKGDLSRQREGMRRECTLSILNLVMSLVPLSIFSLVMSMVPLSMSRIRVTSIILLALFPIHLRYQMHLTNIQNLGRDSHINLDMLILLQTFVIIVNKKRTKGEQERESFCGRTTTLSRSRRLRPGPPGLPLRPTSPLSSTLSPPHNVPAALPQSPRRFRPNYEVAPNTPDIHNNALQLTPGTPRRGRDKSLP
ncbi:hypothetical protein F5148DRAFT_907045 [Russula earlei]|uniref:Uncharacterized protein n=1 Tax=Russula earlei TaxID=71964 RepID=A0ACC0TT52_9AGAM|nr:hypothetical protein F5148DRAFT_907045 [Russula earlei]